MKSGWVLACNCCGNYVYCIPVDVAACRATLHRLWIIVNATLPDTFSTFLRLSVLGELEYRANFWVQILESILSLTVAVGASSLSLITRPLWAIGAQLLALGRRLRTDRRCHYVRHRSEYAAFYAGCAEGYV